MTNIVPYEGTSQHIAPIAALVTAAPNGYGQRVYSQTNTSSYTIVNTDVAKGIEYNVGTPTWKFLGKGCGAAISGNLASGISLRLVNDGGVSVAVEITGESLPSNNYPTVAGGAKKLIAAGDSIIDYGDFFGRHFAGSASITGVIVGAATLATPTGDGTLKWNRTASTLQWAAPGDALGVPVAVTSGVFDLPSGTPGYELTVKCKAVEMIAPSVTATIASGAIEWKRTVGGFMYIADALTGHRFQILRNRGIAGISALDVVGNLMQQCIDSGADIIIDDAGTNDIQLRGRSAADTAADRIASWDQAGAAGKQIIALLVSPRWGRDAAGATAPTNANYVDSAKYTATLQARIVALNRLLISGAASRPWVRIADCWATTVDATQADGRVRDGYTIDGLHDAGGLAYERAIAIARILNTLYPDDSVRVNVGAGAYYDVTNNPGGNLLNTNQGAFAGTGGTPTSGVTAGTGLATGISSSRSGAGTVVAVANKVAATDGGQDWQEFAVSGAGALNEAIGVYFANPTFSRMAIGDTLEFAFEFQVIGPGCTGIFADLVLTGQTYTVRAYQMQNIVQGMRDGERGVIATESFALQAGTTAIGPRIFIQSAAGASFSIRFRNAELRKVLP